MPDRALAASYAQAILSSALDRWLAGLEGVRDGLRLDETASGALSDRTLPFEERESVAKQVCGPESQTELRNLVHTLADQGHLDLLDDIIVELRRLSQYGPDAVLAQVTSAVPLDEATRSSVSRRITERYGRGVAIEWRVDPAVIGGLVIQVGDELIDDSVASRLEHLRRTLHGRV